MKEQSLVVTILSYILDKFKAKNAGVYAAVMGVLGALLVVVTYFQNQVGLNLSESVTSILQWASVILMGLVGSHTPQTEDESDSK